MNEHLKTDSPRLEETDSFSIDYLRGPEIIYRMMLKNYSFSLYMYFIYVWILNISNISIPFRQQEQEHYFYMWCPAYNQAMRALPNLLCFFADVFGICHEKSMDFQECCWTMGHLITIHHSLGLHFGTSCVEWPSITFPARPQERHLLSRPLCVVAHMHRDGLKLIFLLLPLDVTHNKGLRKAINPCDILVVTVHDFTNLICNSPTLFPLNLKQCYEFSPPQGEENPIHPLVFPDILS